MIVRASTPDRPYEIFARERRTTLPNEAKRQVSRRHPARASARKRNSRARTEPRCTAFVIHPPNEKSGEKTKALLRPHGGPQSQYAAEFDFEKQLFAANGYLVVLPNPRGSTGRGTDYAMGIYANWGSVDVEDDLAAVDDVVRRGLADPDRLGVGGWSYGGMSTNYLIATTTRFKAATSGASDLRHPGRLRHRPIHPRLRIRTRLALGASGSVDANFVSISARRPDQNPDTLPLRRERFQRPAPEQRTNVSGPENVRRAD